MSRSGVDDRPPPEVCRWVEDLVGRSIEHLERHTAGTRWAWTIDVAGGGQFFLRRDVGRLGAQDVLGFERRLMTALRAAAVRVPQVFGQDATGEYLLMERVRGSSAFHAVPSEQQEKIADSFLVELVKLHTVPAVDIAAIGLPAPHTAMDRLTLDLSTYIARYRASAPADPVIELALRWAETHLPPQTGPHAVVQGDTGPGNFMFDGDEVTALVDWEMAHLGDPLEDLGWIVIRSLGQPFGNLGDRIRRYADLAGRAVDPAHVRYWSVVAALKNAMALSSLRFGALDEPEFPLYLSGWVWNRRLLVEAMTGAAVSSPGWDPAVDHDLDSERARHLDVVARQLHALVLPYVEAPAAQTSRRLLGLVRALATAERRDPALSAAELGASAALELATGQNADATRVMVAELIRSGRRRSDPDLIRYVRAVINRDQGRYEPLIGKHFSTVALPEAAALA